MQLCPKCGKPLKFMGYGEHRIGCGVTPTDIVYCEDKGCSFKWRGVFAPTHALAKAGLRAALEEERRRVEMLRSEGAALRKAASEVTRLGGKPMSLKDARKKYGLKATAKEIRQAAISNGLKTLYGGKKRG